MQPLRPAHWSINECYALSFGFVIPCAHFSMPKKKTFSFRLYCLQLQRFNLTYAFTVVLSTEKPLNVASLYFNHTLKLICM